MVTLEQKKEIVADLVERFKRASGYYLVDFQGMNVDEAISFRRELKSKGVEYKVAKNTLVKRALEEVGQGGIIPDDKFFAPTGVVFGFDDPVVPAKIIKETFDKKDKPALKAAVIEGIFYDGSQLKTVAALLSKPEVMAAIIGSLEAPTSGIVGSINAVMRDVASLIEEVAKKQAS
jgi:large subunit ribosomal protein L10